MPPMPLLVLCDAPCLPSGLGRITRDLCYVLSTMPEFRIATLGRAGLGSARLPWPQYCFPELARDGLATWGETHLLQAWTDFAGKEEGVLFTIWDPSRLLWLVHHDGLPLDLASFLEKRPFKLWGYCAIDHGGPGPNGELGKLESTVLQRYDRVLAYTIWGSEMIKASTGRDVEWLYHGINLESFSSRGKEAGRLSLKLPQDGLVIGVNMTNQERKDWGLAARVCREIANRRRDARFWWHTEHADRYWSMTALLHDYGISDKTALVVGGGYSDRELSYFYSACDVTMLPSLGEGFGYPVVESMAAGVPCVVGAYGGQAELVPEERRVKPAAYRLDTRYNCLRPTYDPVTWADVTMRVVAEPQDPEGERAKVEHLDWGVMAEPFKKWSLEGIR